MVKRQKQREGQMKRRAGEEEGQRQVKRIPLENERPKRMDKGNATKHTMYMYIYFFFYFFVFFTLMNSKNSDDQEEGR